MNAANSSRVKTWAPQTRMLYTSGPKDRALLPVSGHPYAMGKGVKERRVFFREARSVPISAAQNAFRNNVAAVSYDYEDDIGASAALTPNEVDWDQSIANSVHLIGRAGKDPEVKYLQSGNVVANVTLAVTTGRDKPADWYDLEFWGTEAEMARLHIFKGTRVHVAGRLRMETWQDKLTGQKRKAVKIVVTSFDKVKSYNGAYSQGDAYGSTQQYTAPASEFSAQTPAQAAAKQNEPQPPQSFSPPPPQGADKWQNFFLQPDAYWDNRENKRNPKAPDFKHKDTNEALWLNSWETPPWVSEKLQEMDAQRDRIQNPGSGAPPKYDAAPITDLDPPF